MLSIALRVSLGLLISIFLFVSCEEVDATDPDVSIIFPINESSVSEIVTITGIATDNVGVEVVELWVDGIMEGLGDNSEPYSFEWNTIPYVNGSTHVLTLIAKDENNNIGISDSVMVFIDQSGAYPTQADINSVTYDTEAMTITWEKSPDGDFSRYELFTSLGSANFELLTTLYNQDSTSYSLSEFDPTVSNHFKVTTYDTLGLMSTGNSLSNSLRMAPNSIDVTGVAYTTSLMTITWDQYVPDLARVGKMLKLNNQVSSILDGTDFISYELLSSETEAGDKTLIASITDVETTIYTISEFDPLHENWFWIKVTDFWGLSSVGLGQTNVIDQPPIEGFVYPIEIVGDSGTINWVQNEEYDFSSYILVESVNANMSNGLQIYETTIAGENSFTFSDLVKEESRYFQLVTNDYWGQSSYSQIESYFVTTTFQKYFGGSHQDVGRSTQQTADGGYIITGSTTSQGYGGDDFLLIKTDSSGNEEWNQAYGGGDQDVGYSVQQTNDGGFIITGVTYSFGSGSGDVWLIKTDYLGTREWDQTFGSSTDDGGSSVKQTLDNGFIVVGKTQSTDSGAYDVWLIKTDSQGNEEWNQTFGGSNNDKGNSVQVTPDGGYIIGGSTNSYGSGDSDAWLIKTDSQGNEEWNQAFGGSDQDIGNSVDYCMDGGFVLTGFTRSHGSGTDADVLLVKTDSEGNGDWSKYWGGIEGDIGYDVKQTSDGGFILTGFTRSFGSVNGDIYLIKLDSDGNEVWDNTFGGNEADSGYSVQQTDDGYYIIAGYTYSFGEGESDVWLISATSLGQSY